MTTSETTSDRKRAIALKIKALLAKTTEAGCSESEALAAAHKAHELLAKYQLSLSDLDLQEEGTDETSCEADPIAMSLASAVARYCEVKTWRGQNRMIFLGLQSDAFFAEWLMLSLTSFVKRKALDFSLSSTTPVFQQDIMDFQVGVAKRINERLDAEVASRQHESTGRDLMIVKGQLITEAWAKKNIILKKENWSRTARQSEAFARGAAAGEDARFSRPVARDEFNIKQIGASK